MSKARLLALLGAALFCLTLLPGARAPRAEARCAMRHLAPAALTASATALPRSGASFVVGMQAGPRAAPLDGVSLTLDGGAPVPSIRAELAPGLHRVQFDGAITASRVRVVGLLAPLTLSLADGALPAALAAPTVSSVVHTPAEGRRTPPRVTVELGAPVPAGAIAMIARWGDATSAAAWAPTRTGARSVPVFAPGRCDERPAGFREPEDGETTARVAYVDALGRVSPLSSPVSISR